MQICLFFFFFTLFCSFLTDEVPQPQWPLGSWRVAAQEVHGNSRQSDADAYQRVDGVAVKRHDHQEDGQEAENDGVQKAELEAEEGGRKKCTDEAQAWQSI